MRQPIHLLRYVVILLALTLASRAYADDRSDARSHYQAGLKFYTSGDYRSAIREFSSAQQLVPADLNNYNLALCYDKLGDPEPAIQYYRAYLDKVPNTDKRAEIEASVNRLEAAAKSVAGKKADEQRKADDQRRADDARKAAAEDARRAEEARKAAGPAAPPVGPAAPPIGPAAPSAPSGPPVGPPTGPSAGGVASGGGGAVGTPSSATPVPTGDAQLDRVQSINIDQVRDQRVGGAASGVPANPNAGPAVAANGAPNGGPPPTANGMAPTDPNNPQQPPPVQPNGQPAGSDQPKKEAPVYKKWWFWAVVAVSAYVVYEIATQDSKSSRSGREQPLSGRTAAPPPSGLTLMSW